MIGAMADDARNELDRKLADAFATRGIVDSREAYRERLRELKGTQRPAFDSAVRYHGETVTPRILAGEDPIGTWIEYGGMLAGLTDDGSLMSIDPTGRAWPYSPPPRADHLVLFVPETGRAGFVAAQPAGLSPAQDATVQLLVGNRLSLR
jgi:hypothetical protein